MESLSICGLNFDIRWKNKAQNFAEIEKLLMSTNAEVFILPEMFSTGFCMDAAEIADRETETLRWMQQFALKKNAAICGSVSVEENGLFYNRFYFVKPNGSFEKYDKRHLFSYVGEDKIYSAGKEKIIIEYQGWKMLLQVCYDLRFPVFSRNTEEYDAILYVANWPKSRVEAWKHLLKARAIENVAYVFGVNRIGIDGNNIAYVESSHCFFADGEDISQKKEQLVTATFEQKRLKEFREKFQFLKDRDDFDLHF